MSELRRLKRRLEITRQAAASFRRAYRGTPERAPADTDQTIHNAMRLSFLAQANELDCEARIIERAVQVEIAFRATMGGLIVALIVVALV